MLILKPNCECCDKDLPADATDAMICTFECTFCAACVANRLPGNRCPNCGGEFVRRPIRPAAELLRVLDRLLDREGRQPMRNGHAEFREDRFRLVLVDVHGRLRFLSMRPAGRGSGLTPEARKAATLLI